MEDSGILARYAPPRQSESSPHGGENEGLDDLGAFGFLRGLNVRAIMLELRHKDGRLTAFPYSYLTKVEFDPSEGLTLHFGDNTVKLVGRNLNAETRTNVRLFGALVRHRVPWIQEADRATSLEAPDDAVVIEQIEAG